MYLALILSSLSLVSAIPASFEIQKCKSSDTKCQKAVTQEFLPRFAQGIGILNVKPVDPMFIDKIDATTPNLNLILTDIKVTGLKDCIAKKIERDVEKSYLSATFLCDVDVVGHYKMDGRLLILPLQGDDKFEAKLNKIRVKVEGTVNEITKDGRKYWNIVKWDHGYKLEDVSTVHFDNLFNGNKDLAQAAEQVISESGNAIIDEVGPPVLKAILTKVVDSVQTFFQSVPSDDLILN